MMSRTMVAADLRTKHMCFTAPGAEVALVATLRHGNCHLELGEKYGLFQSKQLAFVSIEKKSCRKTSSTRACGPCLPPGEPSVSLCGKTRESEGRRIRRNEF